MILDVLLHGEHIGKLTERDDRVVSFVLDEAYAAASNRPVLGQYFEDYPARRIVRVSSQPGTLPAFFANLLPEGALRALIDAHDAGKSDLATLAFVGEDLPGAVMVRPATDEPADVPVPAALTFDEPVLPPPP